MHTRLAVPVVEVESQEGLKPEVRDAWPGKPLLQ